VEVRIERKAQKSTISRKERQGMKSRDIHNKYPKAKAEALIQSLRSRNMFYYDPDFPGDEEDWIHHSKFIIPNSGEMFI